MLLPHALALLFAAAHLCGPVGAANIAVQQHDSATSASAARAGSGASGHSRSLRAAMMGVMSDAGESAAAAGGMGHFLMNGGRNGVVEHDGGLGGSHLGRRLLATAVRLRPA